MPAHQHADGATDVVMDEAYRDQRYRSTGTMWSGHPSPHVVAEVAALVPGSAVDVGCGEGADAIWLAGHGWRVTAVDMSAVALERAAARAAEPGADVADRITWLHADVTTWVPRAAGFDLVSSQFMHLPGGQRDGMLHRLATAVSPGGSLLVVGHHPGDLRTIPRPLPPDLFFTADELAAALDPRRWEVVVSAARPRPSVHPDGNAVTLHDAVLRARRRA